MHTILCELFWQQSDGSSVTAVARFEPGMAKVAAQVSEVPEAYTVRAHAAMGLLGHVLDLGSVRPPYLLASWVMWGTTQH